MKCLSKCLATVLIVLAVSLPARAESCSGPIFCCAVEEELPTTCEKAHADLQCPDGKMPWCMTSLPRLMSMWEKGVVALGVVLLTPFIVVAAAIPAGAILIVNEMIRPFLRGYH